MICGKKTLTIKQIISFGLNMSHLLLYVFLQISVKKFSMSVKPFKQSGVKLKRLTIKAFKDFIVRLIFTLFVKIFKALCKKHNRKRLSCIYFQ